MSISIGIDVSKAKLDIYLDGQIKTILNCKKKIEAFFKKIKIAGTKIVLEATGKYHRLAHKVLDKLGFQVMVINPYQSRHFAKAMNVLCKTDSVDAKILSLYAERMEFKATPPLTKLELEMQELSKHLSDLKKMKQDINSRIEESEGFVSKSLKKAIKTINKEIRETEKQLDAEINSDEELNAKCVLLETIPGVGRSTATMLLSFLKELGTLKRTEIVALTGLAPINNESGTHQGKRRIRGGRHDIRSHLYMPILGAATMHNNVLKAFYNKLVGAGKAKKVALTACMRKLIVWANAILKSRSPWSEKFA